MSFNDYPKFIWYMVIRQPEKKQKPKYKRLAPQPVRVWNEIIHLAEQCIDVTLLGEAECQIIQTKAQVFVFYDKVLTTFGSQFYELTAEALVSDRMAQWTEAIPMPVLYTIELQGEDTEEEDKILVTGRNFIYDVEVSKTDIMEMDKNLRKSVTYERGFYHLVPRLKN